MGASTLNHVLSIIPGFTPLVPLKSDRLMVVIYKKVFLVLIDDVTVNDAFDDIERVEKHS